MKKSIKIIAISVFVFTLIANMQYALLDYGLHKNSLSYQLIAQTSGTGGGTTGDTKKQKLVTYPCTIQCYDWEGEYYYSARGTTAKCEATTEDVSCNASAQHGCDADCGGGGTT